MSPASVAENASAAATITVTGALEDGVALTAATAVTVSVGSGTATSGTDFAAVSGFHPDHRGGLEHGHGDLLDLDPTDDVIVEGSETVAVTGTTTGLTVEAASVTITDDDTATVSVAAASAAEGNAVTFTVGLSHAASSAVTVAWTTADGTAKAATRLHRGERRQRDHRPPGRPAPPSTVSTTEDNLVEGAETFTVTLAVPSGGSLPAGVSLAATPSFGHRNDHRRRHRAD